MKVVHLVTDDIGGAGRAARRINDALKSVGCDSSVYVLEKYDTNSDSYRVMNNNIARLIFKCIRKIYQTFWLNKYDIIRFSELSYGLNSDIIREIEDADIVNLHWINHCYISEKCLNKILREKKVVWTLHDMWPFTAGCYYDGECEQYKNICKKCRFIKNDSQKYVVTKSWNCKKKLYNNAKHLTLVGCSTWITECAEKSKLTKNIKTINIPNPVDTDIFVEGYRNDIKLKLGIPSEARVILFGAMTSDSDERKGYKYLKMALSHINSTNCVAIVFGNKNEINSTEFSIPIVGLGCISDDKYLADIYTIADVFVAPSTQENLSNAVMESLSCSTPVVAFDIGGMKDMISHKNNGYLAIPFDSEDLAYGIDWCIDNKKIRINARKKVEREFTMNVIGKKYFDLYNSL